MASSGTVRRHQDVEGEMNLVEYWVKKDIKRWIAGAFAGALAGLIALGFAGVLASATGLEFTFPEKLLGTIFLGNSATELGSNAPGVIAGLIFMEMLGALLGFIFAHFVFTNHVPSLLAMGLVWGTFSWIFLWNLFFQSFRALHFMSVSPGAVFPVCMVFGISLASLAFFDRMVKGGK